MIPAFDFSGYHVYHSFNVIGCGVEGHSYRNLTLMLRTSSITLYVMNLSSHP